MTIENFCLLTRTIHFILTFGGAGFLLIYKYKSIFNSIQRLIVIFLNDYPHIVPQQYKPLKNNNLIF